MSKEKSVLQLIKLIDEIENSQINVEEALKIFAFSKSDLNAARPRIWKLAAEIESGLFLSISTSFKSKESTVKVEVSNALKTEFFSLLAKSRLLPHFNVKPNEFKNGGHTLFVTAKLSSRQTLELACGLQKPTENDLLKSARIAVSSIPADDDRLGLYISSLLKVGFNPSLRKHSFMQSLDVALGGQDLLFREDVKDSHVLEKVSEENFPLFSQLNKFDNVAYVTPLTMKYHLLINDATPIEKLMKCHDAEKEALMVLMRS